MVSPLPRSLRSCSALTKVFGPFLALLLLYQALLWRGMLDPDWMTDSSLASLQLPPLYPHLTEAERRLPQHNEALPFPEGSKGRYIRFGNQLWGVGLNNQLQETFLNTYIAHLSNRAYVFTPFTWNLNKNDYVPIESNSHLADSGYKVRPARVPLTAYLNSPTTGAPWPPGDPSPRSVSLEWWDHICPEKERLQLDTAKVNAELGIDMGRDEGVVIVSKWAEYLLELDHGCVNLLWGTSRVIDYDLVGSDRLASIWPEYSKSPVLTQFDWSPIVHDGIRRNIQMIYPSFNSRIRGKQPQSAQFYPGMVSLHLRRGDYKGHCEWMAPFAEFNGWNKLPFLPDRWHAPQGDARTKYALDRCWIEIDAIVARLQKLRTEFPASKLDSVFVSTNGDVQWLQELKRALQPKGWRTVTTRDLDLTWEQAGVDSPIDMEIASRAEVFVGNGFSSMTSTVTRIRLVRGIPAANTRFW